MYMNTLNLVVFKKWICFQEIFWFPLHFVMPLLSSINFLNIFETIYKAFLI